MTRVRAISGLVLAAAVATACPAGAPSARPVRSSKPSAPPATRPSITPSPTDAIDPRCEKDAKFFFGRIDPAYTKATNELIRSDRSDAAYDAYVRKVRALAGKIRARPVKKAFAKARTLLLKGLSLVADGQEQAAHASTTDEYNAGIAKLNEGKDLIDEAYRSLTVAPARCY